MKKLMIVFALVAGLAACGSETPKPAEKPPETPAPAEKAPAPETPAPPKEEPAAKKEATPEPSKASKAPEKAAAPETKPESKAAPKPADTPKASSNRKPGLYANFETSMGNFTAVLNENEAPGTVASFAGLADGTKAWTDPKTKQKVTKPFYDGLTFHRIISGFMIQGGDPLGSGEGGPGFTIKDEYNNLKHDKVGTLAMARTGAPDSAGSQFYITVGAPTFLDGQKPPYVVFGQVVEGLDVVEKMGKVPTTGPRADPADRPLQPVVIKKIRTERVK